MPEVIKSHFRNIVCARRSVWNKIAEEKILLVKTAIDKARSTKEKMQC